MSKLVKKFDYDLNKNFYDAPRKSDPSTNAYISREDLLLWMKFENGSEPRDLGPLQLTNNSTYIGNPIINNVALGNRNYSSLTKSSVADLATVLSNDLILTDGVNDSPFSMSFWFNRGNTVLTPGHQIIQNQRQNPFGTGTIDRFSVIILNGRIRLTIVGPTNYRLDALPVLESNKWYHIGITYDAINNDKNFNRFKFYINGQSVSHVNELDPGNFTMILGVNAPIKFLGNTVSHSLGSSLSEFALWNRVLNADEFQAVYNATRGNSWVQASGFVSDAPRLALRDRDHATGSYPTRSAHGMPDFNGRYPVSFDEVKAIDFVSNYAEARLDFKTLPYLNTSINLTGSSDTSSLRRRFQFSELPSLNDVVSIPLLAAGETAVSTESAVRRLGEAINRENIGIKAVNAGNSLFLRQHVPFTGSFDQGNRISISNPLVIGSRLGIDVQQFRIASAESISYPTMLPPSSVWKNSGVFAPHETSDILAAGRSTKGIADNYVTFTPGQDLLPFVDSRLNIDETQRFYSVGTPEDVLSGFSARLSSKDSFVIDINPITEHEVYFSTGSAAVETHPGISYFNFGTKRWQKLGTGWSNSNQSNRVDYISDVLSIATGSYLAFTPSPYWGIYSVANKNLIRGKISNKDAALNSIGKPASFAGFPLASKFDPAEGQKLHLKDYINGPFLLEKVVIEVSGVLGTYPAFSGSTTSISEESAEYSTGLGTQFFAMMQSGPSISNVLTGSIHRGSTIVGFESAPIKISTFFEQKQTRSIIFSANAGSYVSNVNGISFDSQEEFLSSKFGKAYDVAFPISNTNWSGNSGINPASITISNFHTGSIKIEKQISSASPAPLSVLSEYTRQTVVGVFSRYLYGESSGGRNLFDISDGRSFIKSVAGSIPKGSDLAHNLTKTTVYNYEIGDETSPMVIFPDDSIVIGVANQPIISLPEGATITDPVRNEHTVATVFRTKLSPGIGRVTFYGSYLRDAQPLPPESSQPLTSPAVHEDVRDDSSPYGEARCMDQFLVEPRLTYSGSFLDTKRLLNYIDGQSFIFTKIAAGKNHTLGITAEGYVYSWGLNTYGQLGHGDTLTLTEPKQVVFNDPSNPDLKFKDVAAGNKTSVALDVHGRLWVWGTNVDEYKYMQGPSPIYEATLTGDHAKGILGLNNSTAEYFDLPQRIQNYCYPRYDLNAFEALNFNVMESAPIPPILSVHTHAESHHFVATIASNDVPIHPDTDESDDNYLYRYTNVLIWGHNVASLKFIGEVIDDLIIDPIFKMPTLVPYERTTERFPQPPAPTTDTFYEYNWFKKLRNFNETNSTSILIDNSGLAESKRKNFTKAAVGSLHALLLNETILTLNVRDSILFTYGWGVRTDPDMNTRTVLGQNNYVDSYRLTSHFMQVQGLSAGTTTEVSHIASGIDFSIILMSRWQLIDGNGVYKENLMYSWGTNASGQLGLGDTTNRSIPTICNHFKDGLFPNWIQAGSKHAVAVHNDLNLYGETAVGINFSGTPERKDVVWAWGEGSNYRLGNGSQNDFTTPQQILEFPPQQAQQYNPVAIGDNENYLVRDGSFWAWGMGRMAVGESNQKSGTSAVQMPIEYDNWSDFVTSVRYGASAITDPYQKSSLQRFFKLTNDNETYYDSHVPLISEIAQKANIRIVPSELALVDSQSGLVQTAYFYLPGTTPDDGHVENANWLLSFPFEPIFDGIQRSSTAEKANGADSRDKTVIDTFVIKGSTALDKEIATLDTLRKPGPFVSFPLINTFVRVVFADTFLKFFYCIGDFGGKLPLDPSIFKIGLVDNMHSLTPGTFYQINENKDPNLAVVPRGFKYGLANAVPMPSSAVFRCDGYGQFRDMLEQRLDSAFFVKERLHIKQLMEEIGLESSDISQSGEFFESPVLARFVSRTDGSVVEPDQTSAQNLSYFATSSLPYFDGMSRDRAAI
jgi:hypothetical protein